MKSKRIFGGFALPAIVTSTLILAGCSSYDASGLKASTPDCDDMLSALIAHERSGAQSAEINDEVAWMSENCEAAFNTFTDYISAKTSISATGVESCDFMSEYLTTEAVRLLHQDGLCSDTAETAVPPAPATQQPGGGINWDQAVDYAGTTQRVCGPLAGGGNDYDDVFLNLGRDYPDPARFQIVVWDIGALEPIAGGRTLCTSGLITLYQGVAQIELYDPSAIEIY